MKAGSRDDRGSPSLVQRAGIVSTVQPRRDAVIGGGGHAGSPVILTHGHGCGVTTPTGILKSHPQDPASSVNARPAWEMDSCARPPHFSSQAHRNTRERERASPCASPPKRTVVRTGSLLISAGGCDPCIVPACAEEKRRTSAHLRRSAALPRSPCVPFRTPGTVRDGAHVRREGREIDPCRFTLSRTRHRDRFPGCVTALSHVAFVPGGVPGYLQAFPVEYSPAAETGRVPPPPRRHRAGCRSA